MCSRVYPGYLPHQQEGWPWLTPPTYTACLTAWPFPFPAPRAICTDDDGYKTTEAIEDIGRHDQPASFLRYFLRAELSAVAPSSAVQHTLPLSLPVIKKKKKKYLAFFFWDCSLKQYNPLLFPHFQHLTQNSPSHEMQGRKQWARKTFHIPQQKRCCFVA